MDWIALDSTKALSDMPTDLRTLYDAWILANPSKSSRIASIAADVTAEFRDAIQTNPANILNADESTIPTSCVRHAEIILYSTLMNEMGATPSASDLQAAVRADIFLRQIGYGHFSTGTDTGSNARRTAPEYFVPTPGTARYRSTSVTRGNTVSTRIVIPRNKRLVVGNDGSLSVEDT